MTKTKLNSERMKIENPMFNKESKKKRLNTIKEKGDWGRFNIGKKKPGLTKSNIENNPMKNQKIKEKASINHSNTLKELYIDKEEKEKFNQRMLNAQHKRPTKPEKILLEIIEKNNLPFNYVGGGQIMIGGFNPDFLSKNPKYIIELNGDYWHNLSNVIEKDKRKLYIYSKYGYKTLVIWEHELMGKNKSSESEIINKINNFVGGK